VKGQLSRYHLLLLLLLAAAVLNQCGTRKNTPITRTYHNLTSYYNILFNGQESYEKGLEKYRSSYQYDFTRLLPVYINGNDELAGSIKPQLERTIEKCSKLIRLHSITAKPSKLEDKRELTSEEKAYYNKNEFNKFVDDSYLLMGKAYFWQGKYQTASKVLEYAATEFKDSTIQHRASVWLGRCHTELGQYREAEKIFADLAKETNMQEKVRASFHASQADLHIRQEQIGQAIPHLEKSVKLHRKDEISERHAFLIAQIYEEMDQPDEAFRQFGRVIDMNPDYRLTFNAKLKRAWLHHLTNRSGAEMKKELRKMLKDDKNEAYRDQIYYALGKIAQQNNETTTALEDFKKSARYSVNNENQKGLSYLALADIYFNNKKYENAQAYYDSAVTSLEASYPGYSDLYMKTQHLTGLVESLNTIDRQDSLQRVAQMTESNRNQLITRLIRNHQQRQQEKARQERQARQQYSGRRAGTRTNPNMRDDNSWYFYSQTARRQGVTNFKRRWGDRELRDNWRLSQSASSEFEDFGQEEAPAEEKKEQYSKTNRQYYLQDLPMSDSAMQASHQMIQEAYFEVGNIYMNDIENRKRAIEAFRDLNSRYPSNPYIPGTYYYLYKLNNELGKDQKAQKYKQRIISEYPESNYAKVLKNPDYFRELEATRNRIEKMYARTLELYRKGRYSRAIDSCNHARSLFDQEKYLARFEYLKTLSIGHTSDLVTFRNRLQALIDDYPDSPVAEEATNTLSYLKKTELQQIGRKFSQNKPGKRTGQATGGKTKNGETPSSQQTNESSAGDSLYQFSREVPYYLVVVTNTETTDIGRLKFDLINFNLDYFLQKDYNTSSQTFNEFFTAVTVKRFDNYEEVKNYYDLLSKKEDRVFTQEQMDDYRYFFISVKNYVTLLDKKSIIEYINFFNRNVL
jgi:tetratricopeptide (TPR) repeat protein